MSKKKATDPERNVGRERSLATKLLDQLPEFFVRRRNATEKEAEELERRNREVEEEIKKGVRKSNERFRL